MLNMRRFLSRLEPSGLLQIGRRRGGRRRLRTLRLGFGRQTAQALPEALEQLPGRGIAGLRLGSGFPGPSGRNLCNGLFTKEGLRVVRLRAKVHELTIYQHQFGGELFR